MSYPAHVTDTVYRYDGTSALQEVWSGSDRR